MKHSSKKIAIISINKYSTHLNYGAALHSYAFQQYLNRLGYENIIVDYLPEFMKNYHIKYPVFNFFQHKSLRQELVWIYALPINLRKYNKFQRFFRNHYAITPSRYTVKKIDTLAQLNFDTYVCESDVIWKPKSTKGFDRGYFLDFDAARRVKRIAYSPSVGRDACQYADSYKEKLAHFDHISVREQQGAMYLSELLGRDVHFVVDPTLLLRSDDYNKIAIKPKEKKYVLLYNCMINDKSMIQHATRFAKSKGLELIEISSFHRNRFSFKHKMRDDAGVEEFLGYFANAEYIVCNAFHGACFSVIFQKEFMLFQRDKSDYRMDSLVEALGLDDAFVKTQDNNPSLELFSTKLDYNAINSKLESLREKSYDYIINALKE
ncbi:MAG: polysaccharide pyruvyl transferase family protein [Rikenellaceae bacterium]